MRFQVPITCLLSCLLASLMGASLAFAPHPSNVIPVAARSTSPTRLYFFGKNKKGDDDKQEKDEDEEQKPLFARILERAMNPPTEEPPNVATNETSQTKLVEKEPVVPVSAKKEEPKKELAKALKAKAERIRLEAERMDAQLTLDKIERLERKLVHAKKKGDSIDELQSEMEALQAKMRGEAPKAKAAASPSTTKEMPPMTTTDAQPVDKEKFQELLKMYEDFPDAMKILTAGGVGLSAPSVKDVNATEVALRMEMMERSDYSFVKNVPKPVFTQEQIEAIKKNPIFRLKMMTTDDSEDVAARKLLESNYYDEILSRNIQNSVLTENDFFKIEIQNITELDQMTVSLFPKACRKEGETPSMEVAKTLVTGVLPKAGFNPSGEPQPVEGGYIIRGTNKLDSADGLVDSIDAALATSSIRGKLSVFFIRDYTIFADEQMDKPGWTPADADPILLVTGPNVFREPRRLLYSAVSATGIASSWYLSIYPFLLNPDLMKRAEEQMSLADANMAYDLTWLTDLSFPLFLTFMGIQLFHEIGHRAAGLVYGMNITVPTFVPSLITGMTSTVTTFKSPPKNKEAMFDFAIAGPLAGIAASILALYLGLDFTVYSTAEASAQFPALPLEILRQSTLGGGIIESILGSGALSVPGGAEGTSAISSINISLHPVAIAGYIGLIVNALALLPIGTTDGGRIAMTLFSRGAKLVISQLFLVFLFVFGLFGSDLFLFYFSFLIFFQQGNEIPARNEVDDVSFSRVLLATAAGVLSLLALTPIS